MSQFLPACCPISGDTDARLVFVYTEPPEGEIRFSLNDGKYYREIWQFTESRHYVSSHGMDLSQLYSGDYVDSNYTDLEGIRRTFERIVSLPPEQSDNAGRVKRVDEFARARLRHSGPLRLLDVGSGLAVFPFAMARAGWDCTALDPDARAVQHAREHVGVKAVQSDFMRAEGLGQFDLVSFNKVLEHVEDPIAMLAKSHKCLSDDGLVYVEVPDGEMAESEGSGREEFFVDHLHVFSFTSLSQLVDRSGFRALVMERVREPSTKFTLRAFLTNRSPGDTHCG